ncbi:hypothetical protein RJ640_009692, partial [Escallonia rubra]
MGLLMWMRTKKATRMRRRRRCRGWGGKWVQLAIVASPLEWFRVAAVDVEEDDEDEGEKDENNDLVEEIDDDNGDDEDVVE